MKKILYTASTLSHIKNFHLPVIAELKRRSFSVFVCAEKGSLPDMADGFFSLPFEKRLFGFKNVIAVFRAGKLLKAERFDTVVLNTSLAAAVFRAALLTVPKKLRPRVIYICHGFFFSERGGISSLPYLIAEKLLSPLSDCLVVINDEDFRLAHRYRLCEDIRKINGMGLPNGIYRIPTEQERVSAQKALKISEKAVVFLCVGEFSRRKNQQALIRAFSKCAEDIPDVILLFAGDGELLSDCKRLAESSKTAERVVFLGCRQDMLSLLFAADALISVSKCEGLPFSVMEALGCGLPVALSDIKGHRDLAVRGNVTLFQNERELCAALKKLSREHRRSAGEMSGCLLSDVLPRHISLYDTENEGNK